MDAVTLSAQEVREAVSMQDAIAAVRDGFIGLARGEFEMPTRTNLGEGRFLAMAARHVPSGTAIVKAMSLNFSREPAIIGMVTWLDLNGTGRLLADAAAVTALRTGAASGVATDLLARQDATRLAVIGAGGQAADQVRAVCAVRTISDVAVVSRGLDRAENLVSQLRIEFPDIRFTAETEIVASVGIADVVCCATPSTEPLFPLSALKPDVHVNAIGAFRPTMRELPDELLADSAAVFVDETEAILEESGEIIHALECGAIRETNLVEIGRTLDSGGISRSGRTVFKSVGIAMQDWTILRLLADRHVGA
jgi:ornithine cyclodeaminase/alanine dehydrogenase-like protein (mu-crystallin family)